MDYLSAYPNFPKQRPKQFISQSGGIFGRLPGMTRDKFISYFFIFLLIFVVYQVFLIFSPFFGAIFWSAILSFSFFPLYVRLKKQIPNETVSAFVMTVIIFLVVLPPLVLLLITLIQQAIELYQTVSDYIRQGGIEKLVEQIRSVGFVQHVEQRLVQWEPIKQNASAWLLDSARKVGNFAAAQAGTMTKNLLLLILNTFLATFLVFVFLKDGQRIYDFIYQIAPLDEKNKKPIFDRINETFSAVIRGQLLTSFFQAMVAGLGFWLIGVPAPVFFAALTFIGTLIPIIGAFAIWGPLAIYLFTLNQPVKAMILVAFGFFGVSLIDNLLKPMLIGEKTKLSYFMLFFGILGGIKFYGLIGIFLAPVMLSLFFALISSNLSFFSSLVFAP